MLHIAENHQITQVTSASIPRRSQRLGYTLSDLGHLPPSKTRLALLGFTLCVGYGLSLQEAARLSGVSITFCTCDRCKQLAETRERPRSAMSDAALITAHNRGRTRDREAATE
jgi:hypothetical protein